MKMMVIKGNVIGSHRIEDLGLTVPYQRSVRIHFDRASWSSDLSYALQKGLVTKVKIINATQNKPPSQKKLKEPVPKSSPKSTTPPKVPASSSTPSQDTQSLLRKLEQVVEGQNQVVESQKELISKMAEMLTNPPAPSGGISAEDMKALLKEMALTNSGGGTRVGSSIQEDDEDSFVFIPSQIRSDNAKVSADMKVEEETSTRSGVDDATKALSAMRKANKKGSSNE